MVRFNTIWDVTPSTAHPRATQLLAGSIVWNYGDEDSPLGNDTGADTFAAYLVFRTSHPTNGIQEFMEDQLAAYGFAHIPWELIEAADLKETIKSGGGLYLVRRDDFIIGLAFAQLLLEGSVDALVRRRALLALRRQAADVVLEFRGGGGQAARKNQLAEFDRVLELV
jgi:uncharacterized protein YfeS